MEITAYPPSPNDVPRDLTALPPSYQGRAALAVLAVLLFFLLFAGLVAGTAYLTYLAITYDMGPVNKITILGKIGAIAGSAMLFAFTLKFLFKLTSHQPSNRLELLRLDQPELFAFVDALCKETGAPRPRKIFVDPDVNAYVAYSNTWLSLFLPVRKDLTIGLGLVSSLDRSEFKAVVAHEFGHFAQRSMRIGSYIHSANTIIHDLIFTRDRWDRMLEEWRSADLRLSAAAWAITPVIWLVRKLLALFYGLLNFMHSSLSREMEFNADKVAVRTAGSEAIIGALWKLDPGVEHWSATMNHAYLAAQKGLFTKNLYRHNELSFQRAAPAFRTRLGALPADPRGGKLFFTTSENSKVGMYASHPPNDQREANAKTPFVACGRDDRPAWSIFKDRAELGERMTSLIYKQYLDKAAKTFVTEAEFEAFVEGERAGADLLGEYHGTFADRFLHVPGEDAVAAVRPIDPAEGIEALRPQLEELMKPVLEIDTLMKKARAIAEGTIKDNSFSFNGRSYTKRTLQEGYTALVEAREELFKGHFTEWDTTFCALHLRLAERTGDRPLLRRLYDQHAALTKVYRAFTWGRTNIVENLQALQARGEVQVSEVADLRERINGVVNTLNERVKELEVLDLVPLPNIANVKDLTEAIVPAGSIRPGMADMFNNGDFSRLMGNIDQALGHCQRLDQKSIASILAFHKKLVRPVVGSPDTQA